eukprot:3952437-Pyramimonas_sp.AAC.1
MEEFDDWAVRAWCATSTGVLRGRLELICCPEDQRRTAGCRAKGEVCAQREVPLCRECFEGIDIPKRARNDASRVMVPAMPARCLANDLMSFYGPKSMCDEGMT